MHSLRIILSLLGLLLVLPAQADVSRALLDIHERLYVEQDGAAIFPGATVYEPTLVAQFYESRDYQPAWTDRDYALQMLQLLKSSEDEGLNPANYHYDELVELREEYQKAWSDQDYLRARAEVLLTDGILLYAKHLQQGKVDPRTLDDTWNYTRLKMVASDSTRRLADAIAKRQVAEVLNGFKFDTEFYSLMKQQLKHNRALARDEQDIDQEISIASQLLVLLAAGEEKRELELTLAGLLAHDGDPHRAGELISSLLVKESENLLLTKYLYIARRRAGAAREAAVALQSIFAMMPPGVQDQSPAYSSFEASNSCLLRRRSTTRRMVDSTDSSIEVLSMMGTSNRSAYSRQYSWIRRMASRFSM